MRVYAAADGRTNERFVGGVARGFAERGQKLEGCEDAAAQDGGEDEPLGRRKEARGEPDRAPPCARPTRQSEDHADATTGARDPSGWPSQVEADEGHGRGEGALGEGLRVCAVALVVVGELARAMPLPTPTTRLTPFYFFFDAKIKELKATGKEAYDPDDRNELGVTAVMKAAMYDQVEVVKVLIQSKRVDLEAR